MEHWVLALFASAAMVTAAETAGGSHHSSTTSCQLRLALASDNEEACQQTSAGMLDLLLGWGESARLHFGQALKADSSCFLAYCGLLLAETDSSARQQAVGKFMEDLASSREVRATPAESFYMSAFLKLLSHDHLGAAQDFCTRADRFRGDIFSACWGILLLHCLDFGYAPDGAIEHWQEQALSRASALFAVHPENAMVCFIRAYIEESAPAPSTEALNAARKSVELLPGHPAPEHLLGHLLYRSGNAHEALPHFRKAAQYAHRAEIPPSDATLEMTALLYESTALWADRQDREALRTRRAMNAMALDRDRLLAPGAILQRWEASTLPLRVLVRRENLPTPGELAAAAKAVAIDSSATDDPLLHVRDCLQATLHARLKTAAHDVQGSLRSLKLAEEAIKRLEAAQTRMLGQSPLLLTPWLRAREACQIALYAARAETYPSTADLWKRNENEAVQPISLLLPPTVPQRLVPSRPSAKPQVATPKTSKKKRASSKTGRKQAPSRKRR